jgi:hypothetical protein
VETGMPNRPNAEEELRIAESVEGSHTLVPANNVLEDGPRFLAAAQTHAREVGNAKDAHNVADANLLLAA